MNEDNKPQSRSVGPDPVEHSAAFNPYLDEPPERDDKKDTHNSQFTPRNSKKYEVHPNPATISDQKRQRRSTDHGAAVGGRIIGSEKVYKRLSYVFELLKGLIILVIIGVLVHLFVATVFRISGESMLPNFADGQFILVDKLSYLVNPPVRGDVVVIQFPGDPERRKFIKRVIALPGEKVEITDGLFYIDDRQLQEPYLPEGLLTSPEQVKVMRSDEYFLVGDNRPNSNDSRFFGPVPLDKFIGKSQAILNGDAFGWVAQPAF